MDNTNTIEINANAINANATKKKPNRIDKPLDDPALESIVDLIFKTIKAHSKSLVRDAWKIPNLNFWNAKVTVGVLNFNFTYGDIIKTVSDTRDMYDSLNEFNRKILNRIRNKNYYSLSGYRFRYNQLIKIYTITQQGVSGNIPLSNPAMAPAPAMAIQPAMPLAIQPAIHSQNITNNNSSMPSDLPDLLCINSNEIFYSSRTLSPLQDDTMDFAKAISNNMVSIATPIHIPKVAGQYPRIMHRPVPVKFTGGVASAFRSNQNKTISDL